MSYNLIAIGITVVAALLMAYCLVLVIGMKKQFSGGVVGRQWTTLMYLVGLFMTGYVAMAFFNAIPADLMFFVVSLVFLFGAVYVFITIKLIRSVIDVLSS